MIGELKSVVRESAPPALYALIASLYFILVPWKKTRVVLPWGGLWLVWEWEGTYYTMSRTMIGRGSAAMRERKYKRYTCDSFIQVNSGDTVVDIGAFIGEFTVPASERAEQVFSFEPDRRTFQCLKRNVESLPNVRTYNKAISDETETLPFLAANNPSESSLLNVDVGSFNQVEVKAWRIDDAMDELGIGMIDFLKVEAEGGEPEVIDSIEHLDVRKIAVAADKERFSSSPLREVRDMLEQAGYELRVEPPMVYARAPDSKDGTVENAGEPLDHS